MNSQCRVLTPKDTTLISKCREIFLKRLSDLEDFYPKEFLDYYLNEYSHKTFEDIIFRRDVRMLSGHFSQRSGLGGILITSQDQSSLTIDWLMSKIDRNGIGSQLLNFACDFAKRHSLNYVELSTPQENYRVVDFYQRKGFRVSEELDDEVMMKLTL